MVVVSVANAVLSSCCSHTKLQKAQMLQITCHVTLLANYMSDLLHVQQHLYNNNHA